MHAKAERNAGGQIINAFCENSSPADYFNLISFIHAVDHLYNQRTVLKKTHPISSPMESWSRWYTT
jgi:hypothetical protein